MKNASNDHLKSRMLVAFFAFVFGALVATLIQRKTIAPYKNTELFSLFQESFSMENLPQDLSERLSAHLDNSNVQTRQLMNVAVYSALQASLTSHPDKASKYDDLMNQMAVSETEIESFWETNRKRIKQPYHIAKELIRKHLFQAKLQANLLNLISQLKQDGELDLNPVFYTTKHFGAAQSSSP